ncbi:hypothetical protein GW17_00041283 [Ensete ventricosum]|nr:hypothetical protein GW17_00041283 [Ensete ventricosum]
MAKHYGKSRKMGQAGPLPQIAVVGYSLRAEAAQSGAPTGKRSYTERLTMAETRLDVLEASLEELHQEKLDDAASIFLPPREKNRPRARMVHERPVGEDDAGKGGVYHLLLLCFFPFSPSIDC